MRKGRVEAQQDEIRVESPITPQDNNAVGKGKTDAEAKKTHGVFYRLFHKKQATSEAVEQSSYVELLDNGLANVEYVGNVAGYITNVCFSPIIGNYRRMLGTIEIIIAIVITLKDTMRNYNTLFFNKKSSDNAADAEDPTKGPQISDDEVKTAQLQIANDFSYVTFGMANIIRGTIETIPLIGCISLMVFDYFHRLPYENEQDIKQHPLRPRTYIEPKLTEIKTGLITVRDWMSKKISQPQGANHGN